MIDSCFLTKCKVETVLWIRTESIFWHLLQYFCSSSMVLQFFFKWQRICITSIYFGVGCTTELLKRKLQVLMQNICWFFVYVWTYQYTVVIYADLYFINKSVFSFLRQLTTWHCPHLLLHVVLQRCCCCAPGSNRSISPVCQAHSSKPAATAWVGEWDRQTDGRLTVA